MKKLNLKSPLTKIGAFVSTYLVTSSAFAQAAPGGAASTFATMSDTAGSNIFAATNIISTASYVGGTAFGVAGLMSLKKHGETPGQEPISKGITRITVGAGMIALPFVMNTAFNSVGVNETATVGVTGSSNRL